jgi:hypothetical protein
MRHGDPIGIGILRKLGHLLPGAYLQFIYIVEQMQIGKVPIPHL